MEGICLMRPVVVSARAGCWKVAEIELITGWLSSTKVLLVRVIVTQASDVFPGESPLIW